jgi:hypothetical protein
MSKDGPRETSGHTSPNEVGQTAQPAFRAASFCDGGECVEVAQRDSMIVLRDSTQPHGSMLHYTAEHLRSLIRNMKAGEFRSSQCSGPEKDGPQ